MSAVREYLFAVQDAAGRELVSCTRATERVGEVSAARGTDGLVRILHAGEIVATSTVATETPGEELAFLRWPAKRKLSTPVRKRVDTP